MTDEDKDMAKFVQAMFAAGLTRTVIFIREGMFYPILVRENEDLAEHARLNPGTLRIEDTEGNVLWPEGSMQ